MIRVHMDADDSVVLVNPQHIVCVTPHHVGSEKANVHCSGIIFRVSETIDEVEALLLPASPRTAAEDVKRVQDLAGVTFLRAKKALVLAQGSVSAAIVLLTESRA